ncbi:8319_t:CDS:2 [Diversispora eburnea]|uniref:8319_t:CDS:1 n=1 Tax=Diversispora eburnea TaxID=1213867 RepID=A0A9N8V8X1_9GLOM|nr:8319_t:CDS:2 [Diversispora eburnea]
MTPEISSKEENIMPKESDLDLLLATFLGVVFGATIGYFVNNYYNICPYEIKYLELIKEYVKEYISSLINVIINDITNVVWERSDYYFKIWDVLANLDPIYRGLNHINCLSVDVVGNPNWQFICSLWVTSIIFGWIIFIIYLLSTFVAYQASKENFKGLKSGIRGAELEKLEKLEKEISQPTQLLLQSGLPDQGIPLQIVLPQNTYQR